MSVEFEFFTHEAYKATQKMCQALKKTVTPSAAYVSESTVLRAAEAPVAECHPFFPQSAPTPLPKNVGEKLNTSI